MRRYVDLCRRMSLHLAALLALVVTSGASAFAVDVVHVEEDWQLLLGEPDSNSVGPQVAVTMSPFGDLNDTFFTLEINHRSAPYWTPGGLTIHHWCGDWRLESLDRTDRTVMTTNGETVTWTQSLDTSNGQLTFQVKNGSSSTWGNFGRSGHFKLSTGWGVMNLNSYSPLVSVAQSGIAYAGNRVQSLKLVQTRLTLSDGTVVTDNTVRVAHQLVE
jgi:hypothetical protein